MNTPADGGPTVDLLWRAPVAGTRGPKPALSLQRIAEKAVEVADSDGITAVSMQRVAEALAFTKMSLYRYVTGKSDLIALMIEHAVGAPPDLRRVRGGWRTKIERWARLLSDSWDEHPWVPGVTTGERVMGPREIGWVEAGVAALDATVLTPHERFDVVVLISGHLRNTQSGDVAGTQPWHAGPHATLIGENADRFPHLARIAPPRSARPGKRAPSDCAACSTGWRLSWQPVTEPTRRVIPNRIRSRSKTG